MTYFSSNTGLLTETEQFVRSHPKPLLVMVGPTASGKTACSIELAEQIVEKTEENSFAPSESSVEIINADSRQLYKYLTIGTAKITKQEMRGIPHHLLDILDPKEEVTAAWYKEHAMRAIDGILARQKIPMLVGGSMLYISAVIDGLAFVAPADPALRKSLEDAYDKDEGQTLYGTLLTIDPDTANVFDRANKPYVIRAMEIFETTGAKPSSAKEQTPPPYDVFILGIEPPRAALMQRINERTIQLFERGWVEEVRELLRRGYRGTDPAMKSHGYREIVRYVKTGEPSMEKLQEVISARTRQYAKRQMTWWRGDMRIRWIDPSQAA